MAGSAEYYQLPRLTSSHFADDGDLGNLESAHDSHFTPWSALDGASDFSIARKPIPVSSTAMDGTPSAPLRDHEGSAKPSIEDEALQMPSLPTAYNPSSKLLDEERLPHARSDQRRNRGHLKRLPWAGFLALLAMLGCMAASTTILIISNGRRADWSVQPSVLLGGIATLGNIFLQYAFSRSAETSWWALALKGTTVKKLHQQWDFGTSTWSSVVSGKHISRLAVSRILVAAALVDTVLLQRASTVFSQTVTENVMVSARVATDLQSFSDLGYNTDMYGPFFTPVQLSPRFGRVMQDYTKNTPISASFLGCNGTCSGSIKAAGIAANCSSQSQTIKIDWDNGAGPAVTMFQTDFLVMNYQQHTDGHPDFYFNVTFTNSQNIVINITDEESGEPEPYSCSALSTFRQCRLEHAIVEYPIKISDGIATLQDSSPDLRIISTEPVGDVSDPKWNGSETVFTGLSLAAQSIFSSVATTEAAGKYGWWLHSNGSMATTYFSSGDVLSSCALVYQDPTDDILSALNEIMFRTALDAAAVANATTNSSSSSSAKKKRSDVAAAAAAGSDPYHPQSFPAEQLSNQIFYQTHYAYLAAAMAVSAAGLISVVACFSGWWILSRSVSLSPIEIARAFQAPILLRPSPEPTTETTGSSNNVGNKVKHVLAAVGGRRVRYREAAAMRTGLEGEEGGGGFFMQESEEEEMVSSNHSLGTSEGRKRKRP